MGSAPYPALHQPDCHAQHGADMVEEVGPVQADQEAAHGVIQKVPVRASHAHVTSRVNPGKGDISPTVSGKGSVKCSAPQGY